ncbi:5-(carboxyamino)imidazole ribonucleotide synthase [Oceanobacillus limi]|uniref:N5-carboxyaminoimidazole ribonucleotide synthase n=1 Tax=Oceanobacillus limi TaxID=930131 RepID=A0A1I0E3V4_9BACI|nr:5-(carboxyamino)imidazole ribonucleotide synthase [Oceanobacillus limi]SET39664.1 5-(carboxyamino)imidazole ribonucleotide synthase [Oceanobacillus limi]
MQTSKTILPNQTIGIIGGGQLGRMMAIAAKYMGYRVVVLDPTPNGPAAQVSDQQLTAAYHDMEAIEALTEASDVVTYEFENVDLKAASYIEQQGKLPQGSYALEVTQNREKEKQLMRKLNLPIPNFQIVKSGEECRQAIQNVSFPAVIKTCRGGYDGKGQLKLPSRNAIPAAIDFAEKHSYCIIEEWIPFEKEISVIFTRSQAGGMEFFPIAENEHKDHILYRSIVPARTSDQVEKQALEAAALIAEEMNIVGTFAIEMFVDGDSIFINEMAPRPHNSGHYTIEACSVSQFSQHIRAICGLPFIPVQLWEHATMVNILGEDIETIQKTIATSSQGFIHLYGKDEAKPKRKMGHITYVGNKITKQLEQLEEAKQ